MNMETDGIIWFNMVVARRIYSLRWYDEGEEHVFVALTNSSGNIMDHPFALCRRDRTLALLYRTALQFNVFLGIETCSNH